MAKITRKNQKIFGSTAGVNQIAEFGSLAAAAPAFTTDPETIQSLSNYLEGWYAAVIGGNSPAIEDMNALCYLYAYQLTYLFQAGVPEWNTSAIYYIGSFASDGTGDIFVSIANDNTGNALTDTTKWRSAFNAQPTAINPATQSPYSVTTADKNKVFLVTTANGAMTFTLPAASVGMTFTVKDISGSTDLYPITIDPNGSDTVEFLNANFLCDAPYGVWTFIGVSGGWILA